MPKVKGTVSFCFVSIQIFDVQYNACKIAGTPQPKFVIVGSGTFQMAHAGYQLAGAAVVNGCRYVYSCVSGDGVQNDVEARILLISLYAELQTVLVMCFLVISFRV